MTSRGDHNIITLNFKAIKSIGRVLPLRSDN